MSANEAVEKVVEGLPEDETHQGSAPSFPLIFTDKPCLHCRSDGTNDIVMCFAYQPAHILGDQIVLERITLRDNLRRYTRCCLEYRIVRQCALFSNEPNLFIFIWRDMRNVLPTITIVELNGNSRLAKRFPPPCAITSGDKAVQR